MRSLLLLSMVMLLGCTSPEAKRQRGGGPGADVGNRGASIDIHGERDPYRFTPRRGQAAQGGR
jgi:hypothetical protein